jgi:hypothetical protein
MDVAKTEFLSPSDLCQGLHLMEVQNNLVWLTTTTNVPDLLALRVATRASVPSGTGFSRVGAVTGNSGPGSITPSAPSSNATIRDPGAQVRNINMDARFVGNTPLAHLIRSCSVAQAITVAGSDPPLVTRNVVSGQHCVSWHARGQCFEFLERSADHVPL